MAPKFSRRGENFCTESASAPDPEVLDLAHLARYTVGSRELEEELLRLFRAQIRAQVIAISEATDAESWRFATHTLKGVAHSIGAGAIARTAERLEHLGHGGDRGEYDRLMAVLADQVAACEHEIARIIGR